MGRYPVYAAVLRSAPYDTGVECLLAHLLGGSETVGRGISWFHGGVCLFLSGTTCVLGHFVAVWQDAASIRESNGASGGNPQTSPRFHGHLLESCLTHVSCCSTPPPQLRDTGDWVQTSRTSMAYEALYPARNFPAAGSWIVQPPESSVVPPALHLHLWHYLAHTSIYVPQRRIAQPGDGDMLYWFHLQAHLPQRAKWPTLFSTTARVLLHNRSAFCGSNQGPEALSPLVRLTAWRWRPLLPCRVHQV